MHHYQTARMGGTAQRALLVVALALPLSFAASNARAGALAHLLESVAAHLPAPGVVLVQNLTNAQFAKLKADAKKAIRDAESYARQLNRAIRRAEQVNRKLKQQ